MSYTINIYRQRSTRRSKPASSASYLGYSDVAEKGPVLVISGFGTRPEAELSAKQLVSGAPAVFPCKIRISLYSKERYTYEVIEENNER